MLNYLTSSARMSYSEKKLKFNTNNKQVPDNNFAKERQTLNLPFGSITFNFDASVANKCRSVHNIMSKFLMMGDIAKPRKPGSHLRNVINCFRESSLWKMMRFLDCQSLNFFFICQFIIFQSFISPMQFQRHKI